MGSPKGKKHRVFTQEEKVQYIEQYYKSHKSGRQYAIEAGLNYGCFCRWLKSYNTEAPMAWHHIEIAVEIGMQRYTQVRHWMHWDSFSFEWQGWKQM